MVLPEISVLSEVMVVVVTVPRDVLIVEDSMFVPSLEALALTEVITCVVPVVDVLIPSVVPPSGCRGLVAKMMLRCLMVVFLQKVPALYQTCH